MQLGDDCFSPELRAFWASLSAPERQNLLRVPKSDLFKRVTAISCGRCYGLFALRRALGSPDHKDKHFSSHICLGPMISAWEPLCGAGQPSITIHVGSRQGSVLASPARALPRESAALGASKLLCAPAVLRACEQVSSAAWLFHCCSA